MSSQTVAVTMPDWVWGRLVSVAEHRGVKVADLIASTLMDTIVSDPHIRAPRFIEQGAFADTGAPGYRAQRLAAEVDAARANGYRAPSYGKGR